MRSSMSHCQALIWLLLGSLLLILLSSAVTAVRPERSAAAASAEMAIGDISQISKVRHKRGIFWDFFQKMFVTKNLIADQYTDTRNTLNDIYNTVNEQFSDPGPVKPTSRPRVSTERVSLSSEESDETTTTTEAYKISRYELGHILGRNFRGLQKLAQVEFQEALNATNFNLKEYKAQADKQFANSLAVEKKNKFKGHGF